MQNMPQNQIDEKNYRPQAVGWVVFLVRYWIKIKINYITMITIRTAALPFILITLAANTALGLTVVKKALYLAFLTLNKKYVM